MYKISEVHSQINWLWTKTKGRSREAVPPQSRGGSKHHPRRRGEAALHKGGRTAAQTQRRRENSTTPKGVNRTPHRAHVTRATHPHTFLVCTWLQMCELYCKSHSLFPVPFPTQTPSPMTTPSLLYPSTRSTVATPQGEFLFGRLAEQAEGLRLTYFREEQSRLGPQQSRDHGGCV